MRFKPIFLVFCLSFYSCASSDTVRSDEVSQDVIYQSYSVIYDDEEMDVSIRAQFRVGGATGTTIELIEPSKIIHNQFDLNFETSSFTGSSYSYSGDSDFISDHEWTYTNGDSEVFVNQVSVPSIDFSDMSVNISAAEDLEIEWEGLELSKEEYVRLEVKDEKDFLVSTSTYDKGADSLVLKKEDLQLLEPGLIKMRLIRVKTVDAQETTSKGGRITTEFHTRFNSANLLP